MEKADATDTDVFEVDIATVDDVVQMDTSTDVDTDILFEEDNDPPTVTSGLLNLLSLMVNVMTNATRDCVCQLNLKKKGARVTP